MTTSIYLVDDHTILREGLKSLLEVEPGFIILGGAGSAEVLLATLEEGCPDVVLMDISLPDMNGIEATGLLRQRCPQCEVIILSMNDGANYVQSALKVGANGYLLKDSAAIEVVEAIHTVRAGERYLSRKITNVVIEAYISKQELSGVKKSGFGQLSVRETEVLQGVVTGLSSRQIGANLSLSPKTVDTYRNRIMAKLEIDDLPGLVKFAIREGMITLD